MDIKNKANKINLLSLSTVPMKTFHMTWFSFFLCFFGWFGIAPLMAIVRDEFMLSKSQIGNIIIASVAVTVFARVLIGSLCDKIGPRKTYSGLMILGAIPVMCIGFADSYLSFLLFRLAIGVVGASFVITQYHTSVMFAPNCVGTANATTAGWGNLGGGVTQMVMPLIFAGFLGLGFSTAMSWRLAMVVPGLAMVAMGLAYFFKTQDTADGNFKDIHRENRGKPQSTVKVKEVLKDRRVWALFVIYGACFGVELTLNNIAALYFIDNFGLNLKTAGMIAGLFGLMNIFARTTGGFLGDKAGQKWGLKGRVNFLGLMLFLEGLALMLFASMTVLWLAVVTMIGFSLCVQMSEGATFSVVPFVNKKALGVVSGVVGAGGNAGAVAAGFLFKSSALTWSQALLTLGVFVTISAGLTAFVQFSSEAERNAKMDLLRTMKKVA